MYQPRTGLEPDKYDSVTLSENEWNCAGRMPINNSAPRKTSSSSSSGSPPIQAAGIRILLLRHSRPLPVSKPAVAIFDTYPDGWMAHYQAQNYIEIDSTVRDGALSTSDRLAGRRPDRTVPAVAGRP